MALPAPHRTRLRFLFSVAPGAPWPRAAAIPARKTQRPIDDFKHACWQLSALAASQSLPVCCGFPWSLLVLYARLHSVQALAHREATKVVMGEAASLAGRFDAYLPCLGTPRRHVWRLLGLLPEGTCGLAYFAAAAAAAAFLTAFAAAEALRRRLVLGGVAGASPMSSAVKILVTNSLGPWSSKSIAVRSGSDAVTMPRPKISCLMV